MSKKPDTAKRKSGGDSAEALLIDRMTGRLGTKEEIEAKALEFQAAVAPAFQAALHKVTGLELDVRAGDVHAGRRRKLLGDLSKATAYCSGHIGDWSQDISYLCDAPVVIALVECLLGTSDTDSIKAMKRPLSPIELDMSMVVFEQFNDALKTAVLGSSKPRSGVARPLSEVPHPEDDPIADFHAAAIGFSIELGPLAAPFYLIADQAILLKTQKLHRPEVRKDEPVEKSAWAEHLGQRVKGSPIRLEARVALRPLKLSEISRLQPGDLLAFSDAGDPKVTLGSNGKDLYSCALGRSGQRYMVRVEGPVSPDENWRNDLA